jgi:hypothetical protein
MLPKLADYLSRGPRPREPGRPALPQEQPQFRMARVHAVSSEPAGNCEVTVAECRMIDATYEQSLGVQDVDAVTRRATPFYVAVHGEEAIAADDLISVFRYDDRWWLLRNYGPCTLSPCPSSSAGGGGGGACPCANACFQVQALGFTNASCVNCANYNGPHDLDTSDQEACIWTSQNSSFGQCVGAAAAYWVLLVQDGIVYVSPSDGVATYALPVADFDCEGENVLPLSSTGGGSCNVPASVTVLGTC